MLIFIFLLTWDIFASAGPCHDIIGDASMITQCLEGISTVTDEELVRFIDTIITYMKNSPYQLLYMGDKPGGDFTSFDTIGDLEELKIEAATSGWVGSGKKVLHFYEKINKIIARLKDCHATVTFPFISSPSGPNFAYGLPYGFELIPGTDTVKLIPNKFTEYYELDANSLTNYIVSEIDFKSGGLDYKQTMDALIEFASDVGFSGYDPHAEFNVLLQLQNSFTLRQIFRPEVNYNPVLAIIAQSTIDNPKRKYTIPWLGAYLGESNVTTVDELSPLIPDNDNGTTQSHSKSFNLMKNSIKDSLLENRPPSIITERKKMLEKLDELLGTPHNSGVRTKRSAKRKMSADVPSISGSLESIDKDDETFEIFADELNKIGYVRYTSFNPTNPKSFLEQFGAAFKTMVGKIGVDGDVIIDVRGNGGGAVGIVEEFTDFFFHNTVTPSDLDTDALLTVGNQLLDVIALPFFGTQAYHEVNEIKTVVNETELLDPSRMKTKIHRNLVNVSYSDGASGNDCANVSDVASGSDGANGSDGVNGSNGTNGSDGANDSDCIPEEPGTKFSATYTEHVFMDFRGLGANSYAGVLRNAYDGYSPISPRRLFIVTDGFCYSCCGIFTKLAVETNSARVIGYGGLVNETISKFMPGSCAGSLGDSSQFETARSILLTLANANVNGNGNNLNLNGAHFSLGADLNSTDNGTDNGTANGSDPGDNPGDNTPSIEELLAMIPPPFERVGAKVGYTNLEFFSRNPAHTDETLYFANTPVEGVLPYDVYDSAEEGYEKIVAAIVTDYVDPRPVPEQGRGSVVSSPTRSTLFLLLAVALTFTGLMFW